MHKAVRFSICAAGYTVINLIFIEDNNHMAGRLRSVIAQAEDMCIVAGYGSLQAALSAKTKTPPQMVVLDLMLPDVKGTEAILAM